MEDLTLKELESLANDYFGCRLTRSEEAALARVLARSPLSSPLLDECRLEMGLEATLRHARPTLAAQATAAASPQAAPSRRFRTLRWVSAAASAGCRPQPPWPCS